MVNDPFRALSHPIRRGIVERLAEGPATVGAATAGFGVSKPAISKHLKVLEETGVVTRVVEGRTHRLSLQPDVMSEGPEWIVNHRVNNITSAGRLAGRQLGRLGRQLHEVIERRRVLE